MTPAGRIVFLRGRLGLSQKTFAELIGKSAVYMNKVLLWTVALFFKKAFHIASENPGDAI
jgi:hypothetical protein